MTGTFEVEEEPDIIEDPNDVKIVEYDITATPRDYTPANLVEMIENGMIEMPLFQRNFVWKLRDASKLIESIILGLPVPELFFYAENDNRTNKIIDGQQRLLSIYFFIKGRFPKNSIGRVSMREAVNGEPGSLDKILNDSKNFTTFALDLKGSPYNGKTFAGKDDKCLDNDTKLKFRLKRTLRVVVIRQNKPSDNDQSMYEIFDRLNTGGAKLTPQEVRACLYSGPFYRLLMDLNDNADWRAILGTPADDLHGKDIELILRCFALLIDRDNYVRKIKDFLNAFSDRSKKFDVARIALLKAIFTKFVANCKTLEQQIFFRNSRFSISLFESLFVVACERAFMDGNATDPQIIKIQNSTVKAIKDNAEFIGTLSQGTSSTENMKKRIQIARELV